MSEKDPSLHAPHMDRAILHAGFSTVAGLLSALVVQGQKAGPLTADEQKLAIDQGVLRFFEALEREAKRLPPPPDPFEK